MASGPKIGYKIILSYLYLKKKYFTLRPTNATIGSNSATRNTPACRNGTEPKNNRKNLK